MIETQRKHRRYLIMTASIGSGHVKAAEAIAREVRRVDADAIIEIVDFMSRGVSTVNWLMKRLYLLMLAFVPDLYDYCYKFAGGNATGRLSDTAFSLVVYRPMARLIDAYHPDTILCTHPFPEGACSFIKRFSRRQFRLGVVLTDYSLHEIWVYPRVDDYFVAIPKMRDGLIAKGFPPECVHTTGIPVDRKILELPDKAGARKALSLAADKPVVLLMGGGLGLGGIETMLDDLERIEGKMTLLVVAGRNEDLELAVRKRVPTSRHELHVWGFTQRAQLLMRASDLIVTKPGALTMSEAFILGLPSVLHDPIPGPEEENAVYATAHDAAVWVHPGESLAGAVKALLKHPERLTALSEGARACARPQAALDIARVFASGRETSH
ncbi:MGDG synthase family glycosyltransferase [uncultured Selenomonas sp.]|uniref:MGDG synthase family glycosyltransferase n=1 Tax=uncultured Selenomonas sp. TaxID=159275 RepID=UPI0025FA7019|nr:glycosyltransferase [uncultured Selenomonas sp.]